MTSIGRVGRFSARRSPSSLRVDTEETSPKANQSKRISIRHKPALTTATAVSERRARDQACPGWNGVGFIFRMGREEEMRVSAGVCGGGRPGCTLVGEVENDPGERN